MGRIALILSISGAAIALAACDQQAMLEKLASPAEQVTAETFIDQLRRHDFGEIEKAADASIAGPSLDSTLDKMAAAIPPGPPISVTLVGAYRFSSTAAGSIVNLTFEYHFPQRYVIANLATKAEEQPSLDCRISRSSRDRVTRVTESVQVGRQGRVGLRCARLRSRRSAVYFGCAGRRCENKNEATEVVMDPFYSVWSGKILRELGDGSMGHCTFSSAAI